MHFPPKLRIIQNFAKRQAEGALIAIRHQSDARFLNESALSRAAIAYDRQTAGHSGERAAPPKVESSTDRNHDVSFADDLGYFGGFAKSKIADFDRGFRKRSVD